VSALKVLLASQYFQRYTDRFDFRLAMYLKREGVEVNLLVPSLSNETRIINGLKVYCFKPTPAVRFISGQILKGSYILDMFKKSLTIVKKESIDLLQAFFAIPPGLAMVFSKKANGRPMILNVTGDDVSVERQITYGYRLDPIANRLINFVLRNTDQVIVPSYRFEKLTVLAGAHKERITVIPWGVDLNTLRHVESSSEEPSAKARLIASPNEAVIISMCRHTRVKGLKYLLYAMPRILAKYPNVKLVLAGSGKETQRLRNTSDDLKIARNVIFPGYVRGLDKMKLLERSDVFVQPSLSDAFPLSALEAMAIGKPIIITNKVGLADFLKNGECGFTVNSGNSEMLADAILKLLEDNNLRSRLGENAREKAKEFSLDRTAKKILNVYHKALQAGA